MEAKPKEYTESRLANNLLNLTSQVLDGAFQDQDAHGSARFDEERLRNQVMRVYRDVDFLAPPGKELQLVAAKPKQNGSHAGGAAATANTPEAKPKGAPK